VLQQFVVTLYLTRLALVSQTPINLIQETLDLSYINLWQFYLNLIC